MKFLVVILFFLSINLPAKSQPTGFIDLNAYHDVRGFSTLTTNLLANLENRLQYFSLTDYKGTPDSVDSQETKVFYTEQNLRWQVSEIDWLAFSSQWVGQSGDDNDLIRAGLLFNIDVANQEKAFSINLFPLQLDQVNGYNWQVEYFYKLLILSEQLDNSLYLSGFLDQNIGPGLEMTYVTEHQVGYNFYNNLHFIIEYRLNEYLNDDESGLGVGMQYLVNLGI